MADVIPDTIEKTPTQNQSVSKPASGTYGERADLARLKAQLPQGQTPGGAAPGGPTPMGAPAVGGLPNPAGRPANAQVPPGVPAALGHPTDRPNVPLANPLVGPTENPVRQAESARDARIALLMALVQDPSVSDTTREWAQTVLGMLNA